MREGRESGNVRECRIPLDAAASNALRRSGAVPSELLGRWDRQSARVEFMLQSTLGVREQAEKGQKLGGAHPQRFNAWRWETNFERACDKTKQARSSVRRTADWRQLAQN